MTASSNNPSDIQGIRRALISVSDKTGIVEFAKALSDRKVKLLSTGGTYRLLQESGLDVTEVSSHTGFPEIMDGRVKTLHPKIHGGILGRSQVDEEVMNNHDIDAIDLVVVNLYPFQKTIANPDCSREEAIENIDIGGPTMVRAAAKNHERVTIVVKSADYQRVIDEIDANQGNTYLETRFDLAVSAFEHTASYDAAIANYFGQNVEGGSSDLPRTYTQQFIKSFDLRYGENPHQKGAFYIESTPREGSIAAAKSIQGKALSYNNIADADAALETVKLFSEPTCVIVKHANPCGVASSDQLLSAYDKAYATDPESAFGGIIAFNRRLDQNTARSILERQFVEVIIAPGFDPEALQALTEKPNIRVLETGELSPAEARMDLKRVNGGLLVQDQDIHMIDDSALTLVTERTASKEEIEDMLFTWKVAQMVKSNAIVYGAAKQTIGVGAGQMSRVNSARIAAIKAESAGLSVQGAVMASDAFFPFRDGIDNAAAAGIRCIIQPGGSMRDQEVIDAANEHGMTMVFTGIRHFRH